MVNYLNGKVYLIENDINDLVYVGSTTQPLYKRFNCHKSKAKTGNCKLYAYMRHLGVEHFKITLFKNVECNDKENLLKCERDVIKSLDKEIVLNTLSPIRLREDKLKYKKDYNASHREINIEYKKKYYKQNKDYILNLCKEYTIQHKDKIKEYKKKYYEQNKMYLSNLCKEYVIQHKDKIREWKKEYYNQYLKRTQYLKHLPFFKCKFLVEV